MHYINLEHTIYDILSQYPTFKMVLVEAGFTQVQDPLMLNTVGKIVTLKQGLKIKNVPLEAIEKVANKHHFTILNDKIEK